MGLLMSVLIGYVGVLEAVTCYQKIVDGIIDPDYQIGINSLSRRYDDMLSQDLHTSSRTDDWKTGGQGYLHITGGGTDGPMVASIKYFGATQDTANIMFSTKISSFGQYSSENSDNLRASESPEKFEYDIKPSNGEKLSFGSERYTRKASPVSLWDDEPEVEAPPAGDIQGSLFRETEKSTRRESPVSLWDDEPGETEARADSEPEVEETTADEVQESLFQETERFTRKASPSLWDNEPEDSVPAARTTPLPAVQTLAPEINRSARNVSPSFWDNEPETKPETVTTPETKEKIKWHYRPLTPANAALPEIHFDSYERKASGTDDHSTYSDEFLRSLDGVKFRPLQRDDGTGRRRSYKKRHSSSSNSSRDSKASREEELKIFTSLEEDEFELNSTGCGSASAPTLSAEYKTKGRSPSRSHERHSKSPASSDSTSVEDPEGRGSTRAPSSPRPHLKDLPKVSSFQEENNEGEQSQVQDFALSTLNSDVTEDDAKPEEDSGVSFWDA